MQMGLGVSLFFYPTKFLRREREDNVGQKNKRKEWGIELPLHRASPALVLPQTGLTSEFGMGSGVTPPPQTPQICRRREYRQQSRQRNKVIKMSEVISLYHWLNNTMYRRGVIIGLSKNQKEIKPLVLLVLVS